MHQLNQLNQLDSLFSKVKDYLHQAQQSSQVVDYKTQNELQSLVHFPVDQSPVSETDFLELVNNYLDYSVKTSNPQFLNQLFGGFNYPAFVGELLALLTNTSMYTYEVAPMATLIEAEMIQLLNQHTGFAQGDGIFVTGGSNANMLGMFSARNAIFPTGRFQGLDGSLRLKAFVNEQAHYSFDTAANLLGIGAHNVVKVKSNANGQMIPQELDRAIQQALDQGHTPFFVAATCATTLLGAYDPIDQIADICEKYKLWLHADGSFGGSVLLSSQHRHLMRGIERCQSMAWNPHKLMNISLVCSAFLVQKRGTLQYNLTDIDTDYLFHNTDQHQVDDLGKKSVQCGRRVDAVKLWFAWKYFGQQGYEKRIDNSLAMARYAEQRIQAHPQLEMLIPCQSLSVCFRYVPQIECDLNAFNLALRENLRKSGKTLVNYGHIANRATPTLTLRLITSNNDLTRADIDQFINHILTQGQQQEKQLNHV